MKFLLGLALLVTIAVLITWVVRRARRAKQAQQPPPPHPDLFARDDSRPDPRRLKVGDVVGFEGQDYVVRGTIRLDQFGFTWNEHLLDDTRSRIWLSIEDDEGLELCVWDRLPGSPMEPGPASLNHDGLEYRRDEQGEAAFSSEGTTGTAPSGRMEYFDYIAGDRRLSFERFGATSWDVSTGRVVGERELTIYPVSD